MRGSWRPNRTATYWPPLLWPSALCLSRSPVLLNRRPGGPALYWVLAFSTAFCHQLIWSPKLVWSTTGPVSKLTDFLSSPSYIIVQRPLLLVGVTIALIQPIQGQSYNSDSPRPDAPAIYIGAFPILTAQPGRRLIYNTFNGNALGKDMCLSLLPTASGKIGSRYHLFPANFGIYLTLLFRKFWCSPL